METNCGHVERPGECTDIPALERLCYFFGQMLGPADLRAEQSYLVNRLTLLARHAIGWGVACGLDVGVGLGTAEPCEELPEIERLLLTVEPGIAFDCCGNLVVLRTRYCRALRELLGDAEREALAEGRPLYVSIEHVTRPVRPSRPNGDDGCDPLAELQFARIRDEVRVRVELERPEEPECATCIGSCGDPQVLLSAVRWDSAASEATARDDVRRLLGRHRLTTITGIGWIHDGAYSRQSAESVLRSGVGLGFSRPVRTDTLRDGVVDLVVYEGGGGRREGWYVKQATLEPQGVREGMCDWVRIRVTQAEGFQEGDRIMLVFRSAFVLDECCRAVSGTHLGGGVPFDRSLSAVRGHPARADLPCPSPPDRRGPWQSGNGIEGGTFETWINVRSDDQRPDSGAPESEYEAPRGPSGAPEGRSR
jgi:hypothetical protein